MAAQLTADLSRVPPAQRRLLAVLLLPVGCALLVAGVISVAAASGPGWTIAGVIIMLLAVVLLAVVLGLVRSATADDAARHDAEVDAAILAGAPCGSECGTGACGVDDCAVKALPRS